MTNGGGHPHENEKNKKTTNKVGPGGEAKPPVKKTGNSTKETKGSKNG